MPLQHQEHETGHDQRLQLGVARIITTTGEVLKRQVMSRFESLNGMASGPNRERRTPARGVARRLWQGAMAIV